MADVKISGLPASTTPLAGTEVLPIVQGGATKQVSITNLTVGRAVSANSFTPSSATIPTNGVYLPAANSVGIATNTTNAVYIDSTQKVGLGTASPYVKLDVLDGTNIYRQLQLAETKTANTQNRTGIISQAYGGGVGGTPAQILLMQSNSTVNGLYLGGGYSGSYAATSIYFYTAANNTTTTGTQAMQVGSTGGLSIGNTVDKGSGSLNLSGLMFPQQATTAAAPAYVKGAIYFDTTLNKLRVGGATAWETITSV